MTTNQSFYPVLVWVHGGGLKSGCSSQSIPILYNGTNIISSLIEQNQTAAIVVTINYRLGVFGDMYLNELVEENRSEWPTAGNYFYLDMISALRWINKNIIDYGGDPKNVLLFGESSGGNAVIDIGALKGSSNLYQRAISQSGGAGNYIYYTNISDALRASKEVAQNVNCTTFTDKQTLLSCLRNASIQDLLTAYGYRQTQPIIDNYFFPYYPPLAIENDQYNKNLNLVIGNNDYEFTFCLDSPDMNSTDMITMLNGLLGEKWTSKIVDYFQINQCSSNRTAVNRCCDLLRIVIGYRNFDCNVQRIYNKLYSKYNQRTNLFWYHLDCNPGICPQLTEEEGAGICAHTTEIPYVFGTASSYNSDTALNCSWDDQSKRFSNQIILHWINTAKTGKPLDSWLSYDPSNLEYFYIRPYANFSNVNWNGNCQVFDQIEKEYVSLMFPEANHSSFHRNANIILYFFIIFLLLK